MRLQLHLLERAELREPQLGLVDDDEVADLEGVGGVDDIEVGFIVQDMVVQ